MSEAKEFEIICFTELDPGIQVETDLLLKTYAIAIWDKLRSFVCKKLK